MKIVDWRATAVIAAVTFAISFWILLTGAVGTAATGGGFIPLRMAAGSSGFLVPAWATPLTATLIHGGAAHLALNLIMLIYCGQQTERALGSAAMIILYGVGAFAAAAGHWLLSPASGVPMIGASGAISAVVAAYALLYGQRRARAIGPFSADLVHVAWLAAAWIGIQALMGIAGLSGGLSIAIGAHIGGFLAGLALARPLLHWRWRHA
jgi:membrane associated rhomboid family serine protease